MRLKNDRTNIITKRDKVLQLFCENADIYNRNLNIARNPSSNN